MCSTRRASSLIGSGSIFARPLAALDAINTVVNLQGYYAWSLMDNFKWAMGHGPRFGLVRVNYETGRHIPNGARWYSEVINQNGINV